MLLKFISEQQSLHRQENTNYDIWYWKSQLTWTKEWQHRVRPAGHPGQTHSWQQKTYQNRASLQWYPCRIPTQLPTYCGSGTWSERWCLSGLAVDWFFIQKFTYLLTFPSHKKCRYPSHTWQCALQSNYSVFRKVSPFCFETPSLYFHWCTFINPSVSWETVNNHSPFTCCTQFGIL